MDAIEIYIQQFPNNVQEILTNLRKLIKDNAPGAVEQIAYGMPAYKLNIFSIPEGQDFGHIETKNLQRGLYIWELREGQRNFGRGKVVKTE